MIRRSIRSCAEATGRALRAGWLWKERPGHEHEGFSKLWFSARVPHRLPQRVAG